MAEGTKKRTRFSSIFQEPTPEEKKPKLEQKDATPTQPSMSPAEIAAMLEKTRKLLEAKKKLTENPTLNALNANNATGNQTQSLFSNLAPSVVSAIEKAKQAAQEQNVRVGPLVGMRPLGTDRKRPTMTIFLDELGRPVDEKGNLIGLPNRENISTLKINQRLNKGHLKIEKPIVETDPVKNPFFDPNIPTASKSREKKALKFHEPGIFEKAAQQMRAKAQLEKLQKEIEEKAKKAGIDQLVDLSGTSARIIETPTVPEVEWWDSYFLNDFTYDIIDEKEGIKYQLISNLIQHPVAIKPFNFSKDRPAPELILTKAERKKLRRQKRLEILKEKQEKIALGQMPAPPPKIKMSNFMRVLGNEAIQDPTKAELIAREEVQKRFEEHMAANEARKLTPEQKIEKIKNKMQKDVSVNGTNVAVFRVKDLSHPQHKFKVDANAQQYFLTGCVILYKNMNLVVVEGGQRAIKRYKRLMLHRIKWNDEEEEEKEGQDGISKEPNECLLVWEGETKKPAFKTFRFKQCATELLVINFLEKFGVAQYWDFAKNFNPEH